MVSIVFIDDEIDIPENTDNGQHQIKYHRNQQKVHIAAHALPASKNIEIHIQVPKQADHRIESIVGHHRPRGQDAENASRSAVDHPHQRIQKQHCGNSADDRQKKPLIRKILAVLTAYIPKNKKQYDQSVAVQLNKLNNQIHCNDGSFRIFSPELFLKIIRDAKNRRAVSSRFILIITAKPQQCK